MTTLPSLYISHGSPDIAIRDTQARAFLRAYALDAPRPDAIVVISAHFEAGGVAITGDAQPETIHDFGGVRRNFSRFSTAHLAARPLPSGRPA